MDDGWYGMDKTDTESRAVSVEFEIMIGAVHSGSSEAKLSKRTPNFSRASKPLPVVWIISCLIRRLAARSSQNLE